MHLFCGSPERRPQSIRPEPSSTASNAAYHSNIRIIVHIGHVVAHLNNGISGSAAVARGRWRHDSMCRKCRCKTKWHIGSSSGRSSWSTPPTVVSAPKSRYCHADANTSQRMSIERPRRNAHLVPSMREQQSSSDESSPGPVQDSVASEGRHGRRDYRRVSEAKFAAPPVPSAGRQRHVRGGVGVVSDPHRAALSASIRHHDQEQIAYRRGNRAAVLSRPQCDGDGRE